MATIISLIALGVSVAALIIALKNRGSAGAEQAMGQPAALTPGAQIVVNLIKMPSDTSHGSVAQDYRFWITNVGTGTAGNVLFEVDSEEPLLFQQEVEEKTPVPAMNPGDRLELCTRIGIGTPKVLRTLVQWDDADGLEHVQEFFVSKEVQG